MNGTMIRRSAPLALLAALAACSANDTRLDSNSGGDAARDQAMAVFVDRTVTDRIDAPGGDHTDWKYVDVLDPGRMRIEVSVDTPEQTEKAFVELTDAFGNRLDRQLVTPGQTNYVFAKEVEEAPDKYYVRMFSQKGGSVYTVGVRVAYAAPPPPPPPPPTQVVEAEPEPPPKRTRRKRTRRTPVKRPVKKPPPVEKPADPPPAPVALAVTGKVVRIIPTKDDQAVVLTIVVPGGSDVRVGQRATVYKGGSPAGTITVSKVSGRRVTATFNQPPGQATGLSKVKFK